MALSQYDNIYLPVDFCTDRLWPMPYWPLSRPLIYAETIYLYHTPARVLLQYLLEEDTVGELDEDWPTYVSYMPSEPDRCIAIFDTTPITERRTHISQFRRYYGLSIMLRANDSVTGRSKMNEIVDKLRAIHLQGVTLDERQYRMNTFVFVSGVFHLGCERGTRKRHVFSLNLLSVMHSLEWQFA